MIKEFETFYDKIKDTGKGVLRITIPDKLVKFAGFEEGMVVKVMIQKADFKPASEKNDANP